MAVPDLWGLEWSHTADPSWFNLFYVKVGENITLRHVHLNCGHAASL